MSHHTTIGSFDPIRVRRLSHIALGVRDQPRQADFYVNACGLQIAERAAEHLYLRAAGNHHHVFELIGSDHRLHHVAFEVVDDEELDRAANVLNEYGIRIEFGPNREVEPGLGRLLRFRDPEGNIIELISNVRELDATCSGAPGEPLSLNHLILYAGDLNKQQEFFVNVLGMRVTDAVPGLLTFLRCNANHHSGTERPFHRSPD
jgi:catechol 2,3-dioxygenase-like lactoylglutathione lyase family enzyme